MKTKILLLSVGSLLGKVMLDILASRRDKLWLIGANSEAETPHLFHCDQAHLLPSITHPDYPVAFEHLLTQCTPDIILPGRDDDVVFLAQFRAQHPEWVHAIPCGQADIARIIHDKYTCFQWAQTQGLPFAHSFLYTHPPHETLETFLAQVSFPLLAKPRQGFGSQGILFIENREHLERLGSTQELLLQEYLEPPETLTPYFEQYHQGMPLFFQIPETRQFSAQGLIHPDGTLGAVCCAQSTLVMGKTTRFEHIENPALHQLFMDYATALREAGWRGVVNLQAKPHPHTGIWKAFELNLRMSGGTACRLILGFDEVGHLMRAFYPEIAFPHISHARADIAIPVSQTQGITREHVQQLQSQGSFCP